MDELINHELIKFEKDSVMVKKYLDAKKKKKKKEEILFTQIVSFIACLNGFELEKEKIDKILIPLFDKYKVNEQIRQSIFSLLDVYKNNS